MSIKTLRDALPREFFIEFCDVRANKYLDVAVVAERDSRQNAWPGSHKNVAFWWELENGYAVGWNENPSRGWAFPVIKLSTAYRKGYTHIIVARWQLGAREEFLTPPYLVRLTKTPTVAHSGLWGPGWFDPLKTAQYEQLQDYGWFDLREPEQVKALLIRFHTDYPPKTGISDDAGWLAPDGTFYPVNYSGHEDMAETLLLLHFGEEVSRRETCADRLVLEHKYVRVDCEVIHPIKDLTAQQCETLAKLYLLPGRQYLSGRELRDTLEYNGWDNLPVIEESR